MRLHRLFATVAALLAAWPALAQVPTNGLAEEYDMTTITGGTTLVDQSGNGHNGTLHGTTLGTTGITFNGTSDYISIPAVVGNSDFTIFACASSNSTNTGRIWEEDTTAGQGAPSASITGNNGLFNDGSTLYTAAVGAPAFANDWHCFVETRNAASVRYSIPDMGMTQTVNIGNKTITTDTGGLGAQNYETGQNAFFTGTIGYVYVYTRALTATEIADLYNATRTTLNARGAYMRDIVSPLFPGRVWQRQGVILHDSNSLSEPVISYTTTDCVVLANPCFQLWYSRSSDGIRYAESADALSWTVYGTTLVSNYNQASVTKVSGLSFKYLMLATPTTPTGNKDAYTSSDPVHFSLAKTGALAKGSTGAWDASGITNSSAYQVGNTIYGAYEATGSGTAGCGGATSTDGLNWTKSGANPISGEGDGQSCAGPDIWLSPSGTWYMWGHNNGTSISGIFRRSSTVFNQIWQVSSPDIWLVGGKIGNFPVLPADAPDESSQMATPSLVEVSGKTYMVYCASDASNVLAIKLAIAPMTMAQLVQTGEGETASTP